MSRLELEQGFRSQILRTLVNFGNATIQIIDSKRLFYEDEKSDNFEDILIEINKKSERKFILPENGQEIMQFIQKSINAIESNKIENFCVELNDLLCLKTFIIGNSLSAADIVCYVSIYPYFSDIKADKRYSNLINVSRWFDMIQFNLKSFTDLQPIVISKSVPIQKNKRKAQKVQKVQKVDDEQKVHDDQKVQKDQKETPLIKDKSKVQKETAPIKEIAPIKDKGKAKKGKAKKNKQSKSKEDLTDHREEIEFIQHRINIFNKIYQRQCEERNNLSDEEIKITLPDGSIKTGFKLKTTPLQIAQSISKGLAKACIVAKVNGKLWDLTRPLQGDVDLVLLKWDNDEAKTVFWHSSSHVLGQSMERMLKGKLTIGPALEPSQMLHNGGFYYDVNTSDLGSNLMLSQAHYNSLETLIKKKIICGQGQAFERIEMTREEAIEMFKFNKYKQEIIGDIFDANKHGKGDNINVLTVTAYRCGDLIDLCTGPHIVNTNQIKALKITKNGATYWKNNNANDFLQRLYGISFPDKKLMKQYAVLKAKALEADHRNIGKNQSLFFFHELSPGSCFWLPHGTRIYNKLREFISAEYVNRGFTNVITPNVFNFDLWKISGHAQNYKENMFIFECEEQEFGLKPMNCPGHCLMFASQLRSYRELPIRLADFGALHRNELSGSLTGLTRVRRFQQDDAHIFCRHDQILSEIDNCLHFIKHVYGVFGFKFELELSTRPLEKYLGEVVLWDRAEEQLKQALTKFVDDWNEEEKDENDKMKWKLNPGDGAFYGPKIDIKVFDSLNREHQCATIQLDFQLPLRFGLTYSSAKIKAKGGDKEVNKEEAKEHVINDAELNDLQKKYLNIHSHAGDDWDIPVIIHRAIYGSFERFIAILTEHLLGKWPFWMSPRQIKVIPVTQKFNEYANKIGQEFDANGYWVDVDDGRDRLNNKIRKAQTLQYNFIFVVGDKEEKNNTINIRTRDNKEHGEKSIEQTLQWFDDLKKAYQ